MVKEGASGERAVVGSSENILKKINIEDPGGKNSDPSSRIDKYIFSP